MKKFLFLFLTLSLSALSSTRTTPIQAAPAQATRAFVVCIDPGHPSETAEGAEANGLSENRLNWQVAQRLARQLRAQKILYVMTKTRENERVTNKRRAEIANGANAYRTPAALFIRLHCDVGGGSGFAWYYPDRAGRKGNHVGPSPQVQQWSRSAAHVLNEAMKPVLRGSLKSNPIKTDAATGVGGRQGGVLTGSIYSDVPTALIEMCFINNKSDARFIASSAGQEKMAKALTAGILNWKQVYR